MVHFDIPFEGPITNGSKLPLIDLFDFFLKSVIEGHIMHPIFSSMICGGGGGCFQQRNAHFNKHFVFQNIIHFFLFYP